MIGTQNKKKYFVIVVAALLIFGAALSGCSEDGGDGNGEDDEDGGTEVTYELKIMIDGQGSTSPGVGNHTYDEGAEVTVEATPDQDWEFTEWTGDVTGTDKTVNITMDGNKTITAHFTESTETYWNAFQFDEPVTTDGDTDEDVSLRQTGQEVGTLQGFTYEHTYIQDGSEKRFEIETTYEGKVDTEIKVEKWDTSTTMPTSETISLNMQTYKLEHNVTVLHDDENQDHPDWMKMTVYLPVEDYSTGDIDTPMGVEDVSNFMIYAKAEYTDSTGTEALFSYYLNDTMQEEMGGDIYYVPYLEGDFNNYDTMVLHGLYGFGWTWFQPFTSDYTLQEGSWNIPTPQGSVSFDVNESTENLGGHEFTSYDVSCNTVSFENNVQLQGTFVPSLPIPVHLQVGDGSSNSYQMELTQVQFG